MSLSSFPPNENDSIQRLSTWRHSTIKGSSALSSPAGHDRVTAPRLPAAEQSIMSEGSLRRLKDSIEDLLSQIESSDEKELERPVCPIGNPQCDGYGNVVLEDGARLCECVQRLLRKERVLHADVPKRFNQESLETFKDKTQYAHAALVLTKEYVDNFDPGAGHGLYIHGTTGSGKTHLAVAVLKALLDKGNQGVFFNVIGLFDQIRRNMDPDTPSGKAEELETRLLSPIVVLDDFGIQKTSAWVMDRLYAMINAIYEDCRTLIVTSKLSPSELEQTYDRAIVSRIMGMCKEIELKDGDRRKPAATTKRRASSPQKKADAPITHSVADAFSPKRNRSHKSQQ